MVIPRSVNEPAATRPQPPLATGRHCDFEVDDALAKLARLGLAARAGETWTATSPDAAAAGLRARWDAAAG
ncbi:MAG: hypothetical protein ACKOTD_06045 [Phycisphaerales bacterium]